MGRTAPTRTAEEEMQHLLSKMQAADKQRCDLRQKMLVKFSRRDFLIQAAQDARRRQQEALVTQAAMSVQKMNAADTRRSTKLQEQIDKSSAAVLHAKRVAASVREQERAQKEEMMMKASAKELAAFCKRDTAINEMVQKVHSDLAKKQETVAKNQSEAAFLKQQQQVQTAKAMALASEKRELALQKTKQSAAVSNVHAHEVCVDLHNKQAQAASDNNKLFFEKQVAASCRRQELHLRSPTKRSPTKGSLKSKKALFPVDLIEIDMCDKHRTAPADTVARLKASHFTPTAGHTERRAQMVSSLKTKLNKHNTHVANVGQQQKAKQQAALAQFLTKNLTVEQRHKHLVVAIAAAAKVFNDRVTTTASRREQVRTELVAKLNHKKHSLDNKKASRPASRLKPSADRLLAASERHSGLTAASQKRHEDLRKKMDTVAERRKQHLQAKQHKAAKMALSMGKKE